MLSVKCCMLYIAMFIDRLFTYIIPRKARIIQLFKLAYFMQVAVLFWAGIAFYSGDSSSILYYQLGLYFGRIAVLLFIIVLIPGMLKRFGITHKILAILMIFRRYIGISMYLFAFSHFGLVKVIPNLSAVRLTGLSAFELWGSATLLVLFFLFITSNDFSVSRLHIWWYRLQRLIYIAMWFLLFHLGLQRISGWTVLMGIIVFSMMVSFMVERVRKNIIKN